MLLTNKIDQKFVYRTQDNRVLRFWEEEKEQGLTTPVPPLTLIIPSITPTKRKDGELMKVGLFNYNFCHRHLLWHLLFRGVTVLEWFILYHEIEFQKMGWDQDSYACLAGVLSHSARTRNRLTKWTSRLKPIHRELKSLYPDPNSRFHGHCENLLDLIILKCKIPQLAKPVKELYYVKKQTDFHRDHLIPGYIGVGYKDKGSRLSKEKCTLPGPNPAPEPSPKFVLDSINRTWRTIKVCFTKYPNPRGVSASPKPTDESSGKDETLLNINP